MNTEKKLIIVLGAQWGDEGKGKIIDGLIKGLKKNGIDLVARFNGGANAGHTIEVDGKKYALHLVPSGIVCPDTINFDGAGTVIHVPSAIDEINKLVQSGITDAYQRIKFSDNAVLLFDFHMQIDKILEEEKGAKKLGTTLKGIGISYADLALRDALKMGELLFFGSFEVKFRELVQKKLKRYTTLVIDVDKEIEEYRKFANILIEQHDMIVNGIEFIHSAYEQGKSILAEGANAVMLDINHGTYPFVTSSNTTIGGVLTGLGIPPQYIGEIIGIVKAYTTRVGAGPFPTELFDDVGEHLQTVGREFGTTTGRKRRCGWLDCVQLDYSRRINGYTALAITKLDILTGIKTLKIAINYKHNGKNISFPTNLEVLSMVGNEIEIEWIEMPGWTEDISKARKLSDLPENARNYLEFISKRLEVPIKFIGVGPEREALITP